MSEARRSSDMPSKNGLRSWHHDLTIQARSIVKARLTFGSRGLKQHAISRMRADYLNSMS